MARKATSLHSIINELVERTNTDTQRIRALEQRGENMASRLNSIEQELLNINSNITKMANSIDSELKKRDASISGNRTTIKEIIKQLKRFATTDNIGELKAMLEIYSPLKSNFITKEEADRLISQRLSGIKNNK
jgi:uncharacterized coiled-coil DUF342 family protein